ncbi:hypothetical protein R5W24_000469 [Gemmata sp. JC717]|uniref:hypothetical protein n=1 Tax=Gemmata algarum TaxID=2975278 RepID=UPI0021BAFFBB|nr:hypothetical protein [Gemmata algarum]MDY3551393.1 hypothetical protein [Gemmata algarum]
MDRIVVYQGQIPLETDLLSTNKNAMVALGYLMQAVLGTSVSVEGLACTPNSPADMTVRVGPGAIHSLQNVDGTAYGTIPADTTRQIVKQGLSQNTVSFTCPAPATTGHSIVYLIQAAYQDVDTGATVLPYYNASNPSVPWSGPGNSGVSQNTVREGRCLLGVKAGVSATTGTQATPAPDAGYVGLYAVTVANGATTVTSGNIARLTTAPFIDAKLPTLLAAVQAGAMSFAVDTSGAANTLAATLTPNRGAPTDGQRVAVKVANTVTGATVFNLNGSGNVAVVTTSGAALSANAMVAGGIYTLVFDANGTRWQLQGFTAASATGLIPANNLSDVANTTTALSNLGGAPLASPALTGNPTAPTQSPGNSSTRLATTAFVQAAVSGLTRIVSNASFNMNSNSTVFANGMTLSRGTTGSVTATFSSAQPDTNYTVNVQSLTNSTEAVLARNVVKSTSGFTFDMREAYTNVLINVTLDIQVTR